MATTVTVQLRAHCFSVTLTSFLIPSIHNVFRVFSVNNESDNYRLHVDGYNNFSTAMDSLLTDGRYHDNMQFSTKERDNDLG